MFSRRTILLASSPAGPRPAKPPCVPSRRASGMSWFWVRQFPFSGHALHEKFLHPHHDLSKRGTKTTRKVQMRVFLREAMEHTLEETGEKSLSVARTPFFLENLSTKTSDDPRTLQLSHHYLLLLAARLAKPDLVVAITRLASKMTSWKTATSAHCIV